MTDEMERLQWRNRFVRQLVQNLEGYSEACEDSTPQVISGEDNLVILRVSLDEWKMLFSSVFTGADICYPDKSDTVRWILTRAVECPVDLCALIADCIANSEGTQAALRAFFTGDDAIQQNIMNIASEQVLSAENRAKNLLKPSACDPGYTFNMASVLVQLLHDLTEDIFEAIEVGTNTLERASIITSGIPVFGQLVPADELLQLADQLVEEVQDDYMGAYDEALYDLIRCNIWCLIKDDCELSIDQAIAFYEDALGEALPDDPWEFVQALIGYLNVGDFGTDAPVYAMHLLALSLIRLSSDVFGIDFGQLALRINAAGNDIDNDYIICSCYVPVPGCTNLRTSRGGWEDTGQTIWYSGQGFGPSHAGGVEQWIAFHSAEAVNRVVTGVKFYFNMPVSNFKVTISILGNAIVASGAGNVIVMNESTHPSLFPYNTAGGALQVASNAPSFIVPSGALRMTQACFET